MNRITVKLRYYFVNVITVTGNLRVIYKCNCQAEWKLMYDIHKCKCLRFNTAMARAGFELTTSRFKANSLPLSYCDQSAGVLCNCYKCNYNNRMKTRVMIMSVFTTTEDMQYLHISR